jgi:hypothetical protein
MVDLIPASAMPKKSEEWFHLAKPTTPIQVNQYFDVCTKWLVSEPVLVENEVFNQTNRYRGGKKMKTKSFGITIDKNYDHYDNHCHFCKKNEHVLPMIGNPYARREYILVCQGCFAQ